MLTLSGFSRPVSSPQPGWITGMRNFFSMTGEVKMVCGWYLLSFLTSVDGTSALTATSVFLNIWTTSKSHQNDISLRHLTSLCLTLFIRIKVKWEQEPADLGEGCWLPPLCCCTLWIYNRRLVSVIPWKVTRKTAKTRSVERLCNTQLKWPNSCFFFLPRWPLVWYLQGRVDAQIHLSFMISKAGIMKL